MAEVIRKQTLASQEGVFTGLSQPNDGKTSELWAMNGHQQAGTEK